MNLFDNRSRGFTLLLAALVASLVLSLGLLIVSIVRKSITLSSIGRDSQFAFYAADTAAECALHWDVRRNFFGTSTPQFSATCDGQTLNASGRAPVAPYTMTFQYEPNGRCAQVSVEKRITNPLTIIRGNGFSTSCATIATNPRALQRSVEIRY